MNRFKPNSGQTHAKRAALITLGAAGSLTASLILGSATVGDALAESPSWGPKYTGNGELQLPNDYHSWVFIGAPLTPHALNNGKAGFPEFHNVYIHPEALKLYRKTGEFPEGTILLKELQLTIPGTRADGSRTEASGQGYFPGARNGIDISVKDSKRFKDTNDWGFFNFGHSAPPYKKTTAAAPREACANCHIANADDMVFKKFYSPILDAK
jgi:hypothetical protein